MNLMLPLAAAYMALPLLAGVSAPAGVACAPVPPPAAQDCAPSVTARPQVVRAARPQPRRHP